jgi:hypothetical protein
MRFTSATLFFALPLFATGHDGHDHEDELPCRKMSEIYGKPSS